ncbi:MAG: BamA/TamA family outer membrane protein [Flavobacteriales bacterium]|nr:BamA/TamA family outer membrane protein [Flavobacteriales bacterium]MCB9166182.1 BamA/TamA family outer membrane protein [Flavobacteriales bacterium]
MHLRASHIGILLVCWSLGTGCHLAKRVPEGHFLLKKNKVVVDDRRIDRADVASIIKQQPNKKVLWTRFYLAMYNLPDPDRLARKKAAKAARNEEKNARRIAKGKSPKEPGRTFGEWLRGVVGEPPVVLDSSLTYRSRDQIALYLKKEGFFHAVVRDSTVLLNHHQAKVIYTLLPRTAYRLRNISYLVDDAPLQYYMGIGWPSTVLHSGDRFDADVLDAERGRVADMMKELGYLYFNRDLVTFDADTAVGDHQVDLVMRLQRPAPYKDPHLAHTPQGTYYYLEHVTVDITGRHGQTGTTIAVDTLVRDSITILYKGRRPEYRPSALLNEIYFGPGDRYKQSSNDLTFRRLTNLRVFDRVDLLYDTTGTSGKDRVNCRIRLIPGKRQSFSVEGFGTNRGGYLGTSIGLSYRHRNMFHSMGQLQVSLTLGLEAQQSITGQFTPTDEASTAVGRDVLFNTVEIGPEVTLRLPRPWLPANWFSRSATPRTVLSALYNYQRRPDYTRTLAKFTFGLEWNESKRNVVTWNLLEINAIRIPYRTSTFETYLEQANDPVLTDSYSDHLIGGGKLAMTYNTSDGLKKPDVTFFRGALEYAGNLVNLVHRAGNQVPEVDEASGASYYTLLGVRYAQFVKLDLDLRHYHTIHDRSSLAFRVAGGIGVPYGNLPVLPFETSFFVGGANGLRAWRARSVGPGSYSGPLLAYDRIGEIKLEANAEYRFTLISFFEGALFVDAGNIWFRNEDPQRPGSGFSSDFLSEMAIGTGIGARLNFDFFLIRFDLGLQMKDPGLPKGERWIVQPKAGGDAPFGQKVNFNLGIGYPF